MINLINNRVASVVFWETLDPNIHVGANFTLPPPPPWQRLFPISEAPPLLGQCSLPPCRLCSATTWGTWKELEAFSQPPNSLHSNSNKHSWDVLEQAWSTEAKHCGPQGPKHLLPTYCARHHRTEVLCPCPNRLELFWLHKGDLEKLSEQWFPCYSWISVC